MANAVWAFINKSGMFRLQPAGVRMRIRVMTGHRRCRFMVVLVWTGGGVCTVVVGRSSCGSFLVLS